MSLPRQISLNPDSAAYLLETVIAAANPGDGAAWWEPIHERATSGKRFGAYVILDEIARGGMGVVYRARQRDAHRIVALKMILPQQLGSNAIIERFRTETEAAASLDHPAILPVYEVGDVDGIPFYSMKFAEGGCLQARPKPLPPRDAARLIAIVARAIHHAHERGVLHRDIKPGNILLDSAGQPMVSDFGLAKWLDASSDLTASLPMLGSPIYAAPEQFQKNRGQLTTAADTYSLGAVLYELLAGRPPFISENIVETLRLVAGTAPAKLPGIPRELEIICLKCLEKSPAARYASAAALADDLERFLDGRSILAHPASPAIQAWRWAWRNPLASLSAVALLFTLVAVTIVSVVAAVQIAASEKIARLTLRDAYVDKARASRRTGLAGQRFDSLDAIRKANVIGPTAGTLHEAIAALALHDLRKERSLAARTRTLSPLALDPANDRYAGEGAPGEIIVRPISGSAAPIVLPPPADHADAAFITPFAGEGRFLIVRHFPGDLLRIWDLAAAPAPQLVAELKNRPTGAVAPFVATDTAIRPDGKILAVGLADGGVSFYDLLDGARETGRLTTGRQPAVCIAYDPAGTRLAVISRDSKTVEIYDIATGAKLAEIPHAGKVSCAAFSPDGRILASGGADNLIQLNDASTGALLRTLTGHRNRIMQIVFHPSGDVLASTSIDTTIRLWNTRSGSPLVQVPSAGVEPSLCFTRDGSLLFSGDWALHPNLYHYEPTASATVWRRLHPATLASPESTLTHASLDYSPDGRLLVCSTFQSVRILDAHDGAELARLAEGARALRSAFFDPRGGKIYVSVAEISGPVADAGTIAIPFREIEETGKPLRVETGPPRVISADKTAFIGDLRHDGRLLGLISHTRGEAFLVDPDTPEKKPIILQGGHPAVLTLAFSQDGRWVLTSSDASSGKKETLKLWDQKSGEWRRNFDEIGPGGRAVFRSDSRQAYAFGSNGSATFILPTWQSSPPPSFPAELRDLKANERVAYSPSGKLMALLTGDNVHLIDTASGHEVAALEAPDPLNTMAMLAFSPDEKSLAIQALDGAVYAWDLTNLHSSLAALGMDW